MPSLRRASFAVLLLSLSGCSGDDASPDGPSYKDVNYVDASFLDRSAEPCSDFYQFACGTWINEHPVDEFASQSRFDEASGRNRFLLREIVEGSAPVGTLPAVEMFYRSCLDAAIRVPDRALDEPLRLIANMKSLADLPGVLGALHKSGVRALFAAWPFPDPGQPSRFVATVYPAGLTLPGREYYLDPAFEVRAEFEAHVAELVRSYSPLAVAVNPAQVADLETHLAASLPDDSEPRDPPSDYHLLTLAELEAAAPTFARPSYFTPQCGGPVAGANH
jgi:putative endopeptidase